MKKICDNKNKDKNDFGITIVIAFLVCYTSCEITMATGGNLKLYHTCDAAIGWLAATRAQPPENNPFSNAHHHHKHHKSRTHPGKQHRAPAKPRTELVPPMGKASYGGKSPWMCPALALRCRSSGPARIGLSARPRSRVKRSQLRCSGTACSTLASTCGASRCGGGMFGLNPYDPFGWRRRTRMQCSDTHKHVAAGVGSSAALVGNVPLSDITGVVGN
eukprot:363865-Chlamydomonas_euryale.AAC.3